MKKLMIAVAAAALVGGAFAEAETAYTVNLSLKTTVGKSGKQTTTYNLGKANDGKLWYKDDTVVALTNKADVLETYFTTKKISGNSILCLSAAAKKDTEWLKDTLKIATLAAKYDEKSANKWCETVKVTEEGCYRVAGTEKIKGIFKGNLCCGTLEEVLEDGDPDDPVTIESSLAQRFGGLTYAAAKKVEIFGTATVGVDDPFGYIAGQGSIGKVLSYDEDNDAFKTEDGISSVSGYFVGELDAPACEFCCDDDILAVAFVCGVEDDGKKELTTAAYGTFSIKYNAKATKALAD